MYPSVGSIDNKEAVRELGGRVGMDGKSRYLPLGFAMNIKLL